MLSVQDQQYIQKQLNYTKMFSQIFALSVVLSAASAGIIGVADGGYGLGYGGGIGGVGVVGGGHGVVDLHTPAHYEFKYGVEDHKTGDRKQQSEVRAGDVVKGEYSLAEPDGTIRVVKYTADDHNGFNAIVQRIGHAAHPQVLIKKAVVPVATHGYVGGLGLGGLDGGLGYGNLGGGYGGVVGGGYGGGLLGGHAIGIVHH